MGSATPVVQQYVFLISGTSIRGQINNWDNANVALVCDSVDLCPTPINNGLPAGYKLTVELNYDNTNVTGATFKVIDNHGTELANKPFPVSQAQCNCGIPPGFSCVGFQAGDVAPITAFTVDIVGPGGGNATKFSSGSGNLSYSVQNGQSITAVTNQPGCIAFSFQTAENSNAIYGPLNACPAPTLTQWFKM
jgi:hypothetical protein